jgi:hypothetical protein
MNIAPYSKQINAGKSRLPSRLFLNGFDEHTVLEGWGQIHLNILKFLL